MISVLETNTTSDGRKEWVFDISEFMDEGMPSLGAIEAFLEVTDMSHQEVTPLPKDFLEGVNKLFSYDSDSIHKLSVTVVIDEYTLTLEDYGKLTIQER